jgi:hypothetical protein
MGTGGAGVGMASRPVAEAGTGVTVATWTCSTGASVGVGGMGVGDAVTVGVSVAGTLVGVGVLVAGAAAGVKVARAMASASVSADSVGVLGTAVGAMGVDKAGTSPSIATATPVFEGTEALE